MATTKATLLAHRSATSFSDLTLSGDLTVSGTTTTIDTEVVVSDATVINNAGSDVGLKINSTSSSHIMQLQDGGTDIITVKDGGEVYISTFVGMIAPFAMATAPSGWLVCDGSAVSKTTYSALFTALGANAWGTDTTDNFYLPDLRGAFLRGTGSHGTSNMADGNDFAGPSVGSFENDQFQGHLFGDVSDAYSGTTGGSPIKAPLKIRDNNQRNRTVSTVADNNHGAVDTQAGSYTGALIPIDDQTNGNPRTGDETRPFNAGVKYCIKF